MYACVHARMCACTHVRNAFGPLPLHAQKRVCVCARACVCVCVCVCVLSVRNGMVDRHSTRTSRCNTGMRCCCRVHNPSFTATCSTCCFRVHLYACTYRCVGTHTHTHTHTHNTYNTQTYPQLALVVRGRVQNSCAVSVIVSGFLAVATIFRGPSLLPVTHAHANLSPQSPQHRTST